MLPPIRASQLGMKTAVIEKAELGGICLNWGCIPTKSIIKVLRCMNTYYTHRIMGKSQRCWSRFSYHCETITGCHADAMSKGSVSDEKNKIDVHQGSAKIKSGKKIGSTFCWWQNKLVWCKTYSDRYRCPFTQLPNLKQDGKKLSDTVKQWYLTNNQNPWLL